MKLGRLRCLQRGPTGGAHTLRAAGLPGGLPRSRPGTRWKPDPAGTLTCAHESKGVITGVRPERAAVCGLVKSL